jgi:hypothetical protein
VLAAVDQPLGDEDFQFVIEAVPISAPAAASNIGRLRWRLFILLSLLAGREVGVGPVRGVGADGRVVWAEWGPPRLRHGRPALRWCPDLLVTEVLPPLAEGFARIARDPTFEQVLDRAINLLLAAGSGEVLDARVPVSCAGPELLGWAVLQRQGWIGADAVSRLPTSAVVRLLMQWAGIPTTIPEELDALARRAARVGQPDWAGPEVLFNVRNALLHPPRRLDEPDWPIGDELTQSWQLATWYLELVVLRILGYSGSYWSRLRLHRWYNDLEQLPWEAGAPG